MPIPIRLNGPNGPNGGRENENGYNLDLASLLGSGISETPKPSKTVEASNKDASALMDLWENGEKIGEFSYKVNGNVHLSQSDLARLKANGFLVMEQGKLIFTRKARQIITTMTLAESNAFLKNKKNVSYKEILASMDKRNKKGYRIPNPRFSSSSFNNIRLS